MSWLQALPSVNASLNALATVLLLAGLIAIKSGRPQLHRRLMISAFITSVVFLICYLVYHFNVLSVPFTAQGAPRAVYFFILLTHIVLAMAVPPLAIITLHAGLRQRFDRHRKIARWTWPIWMYVSVTGVVVYLMLYHLYPSEKLPTAGAPGRVAAAEVATGR